MDTNYNPATTLDMAIAYAKRGFSVYRIYPMVNGECACNNTNEHGESEKCAHPGKHPNEPRGVHSATKDVEAIRERFRRTTNIGIATGEVSGILVVDLDPRNGSDETLKRLEREGKTFPRTFTVETGGGGQHLYYRYTPRAADITTPGDGIDIKSNGGGVVAPPSNHESGGHYRVVDEDEVVADIPEWLYSYVKSSDPDNKPLIKKFGDRSIEDMVKNGFVKGERHEGFLYLAGRMYHSGMDQAACELQAEVCAFTCTPPGSIQDAVGRVKEQFRRGGEKNPNWGLPKAKREKQNELAIAIRRVDQKMGSLISYDEFSYRMRWITADRPWPTHSDDLTETDMVLLAADVGFSTARTKEALRAFRAFHRHHPVRDYLDSVKWDGTPRLNRLLPDYFHSEDTKYAHQAGRKLLMAAVARIYIPGCKSDYTVVLEGEQGAKKSSGVEALCPNQEWFLDNLGDISRDQQVGQRMAGKWIIEIAELASFSKSEIDMLKAFMTRKDDRFREPYDINDTSHLRQSAFFGTINTKDDSGYLIDETGNRRFWPLMVKDVDVDAIKRDRDQLWAEAVVAFRSGEKWYFTDADVIASAVAAQEERVVADVWLDPIANKVLEVARERLASSTEKEIVVTAAYVLERWLSFHAKDMKQADKNRVTKCLKSLNFKSGKQVRDGGTRSWTWILNEAGMRALVEPTKDRDDECPRNNVVPIRAELHF